MTQAMSAKKQTAHLNRLKALSHPVRSKILLLLGERTLSPKEIAEETDGDVREISRQCKLLQKWGCAELVDTRPRRGATEHFYRATELHLVDDDEWDELHPLQQDHVIGDIVSAIFGDLVRAFKGGILGRNATAEELTRTPLYFDEEGRDKAVALMKATRAELLEISIESEHRNAKSKTGGSSYSTFLGFFKLPAP